jgi:MFS family permease
MSPMSEPPGIAAGQRWRTLAAIIACVSVFGATLGLTLPLLSILLERQGVSATLIGLNAATPALAILIGSFFVPVMVRRLGARRYMLMCLATSVATLLLMPAFPNVWAWFPIRFVMGFAISGLFVVSESWINQAADDAHRGRIVGVYTTVLSLGFLIGPAILSIVGIDPVWPFILAAAVTGLAFLPLATPGLWLPPTGQHGVGRGALSFFGLVPLLMGAAFLASFGDGAAMALLPLFALQHGLPETQATFAIGVAVIGGLCFQVPAGWLADRIGGRRVMVIGGLIGTAGAFLLPAVVGGPLLWPVLFVWGGALIALYTLALIVLGQRFTGLDLVAGNAAFGIVWGLGNLLGPAVGGAAMDLFGPSGMPALLGGAAAIFTLGALLRAPGKA